MKGTSRLNIMLNLFIPLRTNTTGAGDRQDVKDRELTHRQMYKIFTFVQKNAIILQISSLLSSSWRGVGAEPCV